MDSQEKERVVAELEVEIKALTATLDGLDIREDERQRWLWDTVIELLVFASRVEQRLGMGSHLQGIEVPDVTWWLG